MTSQLIHRSLTIAEMFGVTPTIFISVKTTETAHQLSRQSVSSVPTTAAFDLTKPLILSPSNGKQFEKFFTEYWPALAMAGLGALIIYSMKHNDYTSFFDEE